MPGLERRPVPLQWLRKTNEGGAHAFIIGDRPTVAACGHIGRSAHRVATGPAQSRPVRVGVLTDLSGPHRDTGGPTSVAAARLAMEDFAAAGNAMPVEIVSADHQQKPDVAVALVREWFDRGGVDAPRPLPALSRKCP